MTTFCVLPRIRSFTNTHLNLKHFTNYSTSIIKENDLESYSEIRKINKKRMKGYQSCHIIDSKVADLVIENLNLSKYTNDTIIMEANPGPGILTEKLLKIPYFKKLILFEQRKEFVPKLESLNGSNEDRLVIIPEEFYMISKLFASSLRSENQKSETLKMLSSIEWKDPHEWSNNNEPSLKVIGFIHPVKEGKFLSYLCAKLPYFDSLFSHGFCEFYFFISEKEYMYMKSKPKEKPNLYTGLSVLFQLFFDIDLIDKVPNSAFEPKPYRKSLTRAFNYDTSITCFVKMVPKGNITNLVPEGYLPDLYYFIRQNMVNRNLFVIANLEKWIPDCGPRLIKNGLPIFTKFGELSPQEILFIFNQFSSWSEYELSAFKSGISREGLFQAQEDDEEIN